MMCDSNAEGKEEHWLFHYDFDFEGEKLVMVSVDRNNNGYYNGNFWMEVYDNTGLLYQGKYNTSLDTGRNLEVGDFDCGIYADDILSVKWN